MEFQKKCATEQQLTELSPSNEIKGVDTHTGVVPAITASPGNLHRPSRIDPSSFPDMPLNRGGQLPSTIANIEHLLTSYGISARYDVIKKKLLITMPGHSGTVDNADNVLMTYIVSLANLNGLSAAQIHSYVAAIGDRHQLNPVAAWIKSSAWDGNDRLDAFYETLTHREDFPAALKKTLLYRWLISAVAAALKPSGFRARGVLTLQGPQSIGKTTWINRLVSDPMLRELVIKLDHHLDASNKDSILTAVAHWIVEIGELDSSFKKDIARLKGFLTSDRDKLRRPYARTDSEYPRRTVFCASVNEQAFLVDATGNTRWWTIPVTGINYNHGIDMQQVFAQVALDFQRGEPWWLTQAEEGQLESYNSSHRAISVIGECILGALDLSRANADNLPAMTPSSLLTYLGYNKPSNAQAKECAAILREHLGESKRINGQNVWRIPLKSTASGSAPVSADDDDLY